MNSLITLVAAAALGASNANVLLCSQPIVVKGEIKGGPPLVQVFELRNTSADGLVTITSFEAGCGCIRKHCSSTVLKPGETAKLTIEINTLTQPEGPNRWPISVRSRIDRPGSAQDQPTLELLISATLRREVTLTPPQIALSTSGEVVRTLTLTDRRAKPLTLIRTESTSPHLTAVIAPHQSGETQVTLKLAADAPPGIRDETIVLYSDDAEYPEFRVPVRVEKRAAGQVLAVPESVSLRFAPGEPAVSALVQLRSADGKELTIEKVESDHPSVTAKWSTTRGPIATVRVTVAASSTAAGTKGQVELRVRLAEPAGQVVSVPVSWTTR